MAVLVPSFLPPAPAPVTESEPVSTPSVQRAPSTRVISTEQPHHAPTQLEPYSQPPASAKATDASEQRSSASTARLQPAPGQLQPSSHPPTDTKSTDTEVPEPVVPHVTLPQHTIDPSVAAALANSMLGHILFLKGQIPLYVLTTLPFLTLISNTRSIS